MLLGDAGLGTKLETVTSEPQASRFQSVVGRDSLDHG